MITPELWARINELARKKRSVGLSAEETVEQKKLYEVYLTAIRGQVTGLLESIEFVDAPAKSEVEKKNQIMIKQATINLRRVYH